MTQFQKISLFFLRISLGWMFFWAGITKVLNPEWSAAGYLKGAKMFTGFYGWLASPNILPIVNFVNEWGLTLLGISLILGVFLRFSAILGALLMLLYYLALEFPKPNPNSFIVDQHIIYVFALLLLGFYNSGETWGLDKLLHRAKLENNSNQKT